MSNTIQLIDMLVAKHNIDKEKTIQYIHTNYNQKNSFKLFLSGLIFDLSNNTNNIQTKLS